MSDNKYKVQSDLSDIFNMGDEVNNANVTKKDELLTEVKTHNIQDESTNDNPNDLTLLNTTTPIDLSLNDTLNQKEIVWKKTKKAFASQGSFSIEDTIKQNTEQYHTQFFLNLVYLLTNGFNAMMAFYFNPYLKPRDYAKKISDAEIKKMKFSNPILNTETLKDSINLDTNQFKTAFDLDRINYLVHKDEKHINQYPLLLLTHNFQIAYTNAPIPSDKTTMMTYNVLTYLNELQRLYNTMPEKIVEFVFNNLTITDFFVNHVEYGFDDSNKYQTLKDVENSSIKGLFFEKLENIQTNSDITAQLWLISKAVIEKNLTFITFFEDYDWNIVQQHFTTNNGYMGHSEIIDIFKKHSISFSALIQSLPTPFNDLIYKSVDYVDSYHMNQTKTFIDYNALIEKWINVEFDAMVDNNQNTYSKQSFFLNENNLKYQKLNFINLDEFYKMFIKAIFNIITMLILFKDKNNKEINIADFLSKEYN